MPGNSGPIPARPRERAAPGPEEPAGGSRRPGGGEPLAGRGGPAPGPGPGPGAVPPVPCPDSGPGPVSADRPPVTVARLEADVRHRGCREHGVLAPGRRTGAPARGPVPADPHGLLVRAAHEVPPRHEGFAERFPAEHEQPCLPGPGSGPGPGSAPAPAPDRATGPCHRLRARRSTRRRRHPPPALRQQPAHGGVPARRNVVPRRQDALRLGDIGHRARVAGSPSRNRSSAGPAALPAGTGARPVGALRRASCGGGRGPDGESDADRRIPATVPGGGHRGAHRGARTGALRIARMRSGGCAPASSQRARGRVTPIRYAPRLLQRYE